MPTTSYIRPATVSNIDSTFYKAWANSNYIFYDDSLWTSCAPDPSGDYLGNDALFVYNFPSFNVPPNAVITKAHCLIKGYTTKSDGIAMGLHLDNDIGSVSSAPSVHTAFTLPYGIADSTLYVTLYPGVGGCPVLTPAKVNRDIGESYWGVGFTRGLFGSPEIAYLNNIAVALEYEVPSSAIFFGMNH